MRVGAETRFRGVLDEVAVEPYAAVAARLGYGMVSRRLRGVLTAFGGFGFGEGGRPEGAAGRPLRRPPAARTRLRPGVGRGAEFTGRDAPTTTIQALALRTADYLKGEGAAAIA